MKLENWRGWFLPQILQRGKDYFLNGRVGELKFEGNIVRATVLGTDRYQVELAVENGQRTDWSCTCPYAERGDLCKHVAAVCYALEREDRVFPEVSALSKLHESPRGEPRLEDLVDRLTLGEVRELLLTTAERHRDVASAIRGLTLRPQTGSKPKWQKDIDRILWKNANENGYLDYRHAWDTISEVDNYVDRLTRQLMKKGKAAEAFDVTGYAFQAVGDFDMDDSDGGLSYFGGTCCDLWEEQVEGAPKKLKEKMYQWFSQVGETCSLDLYREIARRARMELFCTPEYLRKNLSRLDYEIKTAEERERSWRVSELVLEKLGLLEELGAPKETLDQLEKTYWHLPQIRQRAVDRFLDLGETGRAIAILKEGKEQDDFPEHCSQQLIEIYRESGQTEKFLEELNYQVFQCNQDDLENIKLLKAQLPEKAWPECFEKILASETTRYLRGDLLAWEEQYERLLTYAVEEGSLTTLDKWERELGSRFPEKILSAYVSLLDAKMKAANGRGYYAQLISYFKILKRYPGGEEQAQKLAVQWRIEYPRRTSMYDELHKAGY